MLDALRGFVFDLDGCVWQGERLNPGAAETLAALHHAGRGIAYLTNNSRARGADVAAKLRRLGVTPSEPALTPLEILGDVVRQRWSRSHVLVMGAPELAAALTRLLNDPETRRRMGQAGRRRVEAQFSWASVAERTERVYGDAIADFKKSAGD